LRFYAIFRSFGVAVEDRTYDSWDDIRKRLVRINGAGGQGGARVEVSIADTEEKD